MIFFAKPSSTLQEYHNPKIINTKPNIPLTKNKISDWTLHGKNHLFWYFLCTWYITLHITSNYVHVLWVYAQGKKFNNYY